MKATRAIRKNSALRLSAPSARKILFVWSALFLPFGFDAALAATNGLLVPPEGLGPLTFDTTPPATEWSTLSVAGGGPTYLTVTALEASVQALTAASITNPLGVTDIVPPFTYGRAYHNLTGLFLQTRPTGNAYTVLMATLLNSTGKGVDLLRVAYDLNSFSPAAEEIPGLRAYYSLTGTANSWHLIPELTTTNTGPQLAEITLAGTWPPGSQMSLIWVDDNSNGSTDPAYTIDNVVISGPLPPLSIAIFIPTNGQAFVQSQAIPVITRITGLIGRAELLLDGVGPEHVVGTATTEPFTFTLDTTGLSLGPHTLWARGYHSEGSVLSSNAVTINLLPNAAPFLTITNPPVVPVLVGTAITNLVTATDDVAVVRVEWSLGDTPVLARSNAPWTYVYNDSLPATNLAIRAVAFDGTGLSASATNWITVTNPPASVALIVTNGSEWKYYATSNAPPAQGNLEWFMPGYDRSGWGSGFAELGGGDGALYPERTVIDFHAPTYPPGDYRAIYFARAFDWPDGPANCAELAAVFRLLRDDGAAVYLNGRLLWTDNLVLTNGYEALAGLAVDDGTVYQEVRVSCPLLHDLGSDLFPSNNVIAVEVHQADIGSSDLSFDLMLWGESYAPPALAIVSPTNGTPIVHGTPVNVTVASTPFVRAVDLYLDGILVATDNSPAVTEPQFSLPVIFNSPPRPHTLWVVGTDTLSNAATSAPVTVLPDRESLIPFGVTWKYDDTGTDLGTAWRAPDFDDSRWSEGPAELGYGDGDEATVISFGPDELNKRPTAYFRHAFDVATPAAVTNLSVRVKRDDGVVVYLNGTEVLRNNMPGGTISYATWATGVGEGEVVTGCVPPSLLVAGRNVIAAEVHQYNGSSSDLSFDLALVAAVPAVPPTVAVTVPTNGTSLAWGRAVVISASAADADCAVARVEFYDGDTLIGTDSTAPYQATWTAVPGTRTLSAKAIDTHGLFAISSVVVTVAATGPLTLADTNAVWKYLDTGSDQASAWTVPGFDDSTWWSGPGSLGYGNPVTTTVGFGPDPSNKYITTYFRRAFNSPVPSLFTNVIVRLRRDDGGVVYINGVEVFRSNMTNDVSVPIRYNDFAGPNSGSEAETEFNVTNVSPGVLQFGLNVVAAEIHQQSLASSDISFELQLVALAPPASLARLQIVLVDHDGDPNTAPVPELRWTAAGFSLIQSADLTQPLSRWSVVPGNPPSGYRPPMSTGMFYALKRL